MMKAPAKLTASTAVTTVLLALITAMPAHAGATTRYEFAGGRCAMVLSWDQRYSSPKEVKVVNNSGGLVQASVKMEADYSQPSYTFFQASDGSAYRRFSGWLRLTATPYCRVGGQLHQGPTRSI